MQVSLRLFGSEARRWRLTVSFLVAAVIAILALMSAAAGRSAGSYDPAQDSHSMANTTLITSVQNWWNQGYTGKGIDVAVIDTGVAPVSGLDAPGKVVYGPDLSLESQDPNSHNLDTNGHGTFMAGLIAGHDGSSYRGVAPDARIVSLKVGDADGGVDVTQVIAAIDWVVQHAHDPGFNIRVINLSYGTNSTQDPTTDPLAYAVEQAWKKGIVVVAAAGNSGYQLGANAPGLADPAYDGFVIGVGAYDTNGTSTVNDDTVGTFSASSTGAHGSKLPDFLAPGAHMQGLRVGNSYIDANHPEGMLGGNYFRGSGTSEAAAWTSGVVALVLQKYPGLTPDQVKGFLMQNAVKLQGADTNHQGFGEISLSRMSSQKPPSGVSGGKPTASTGLGSIEGSRGTDHITSTDGVVLSGGEDIFGHSFTSNTMATAEAAGNTWSGGNWNGNTWSGNTWSGNTWSGNTWSGNTWSGNTWSGNTWSGNTWSGNTWSGNTWSGASLSGNTWSGGTWSGGVWQGVTWS